MLFRKGLIRINNKYFHKVMNNETLWDIHKKYGVSIKELQRLNHMKSVSTQGKSMIMVFRKPVLHEVEENETLEQISNEYEVDIERIKKFNGLSSDNLVQGDIIIVKD